MPNRAPDQKDIEILSLLQRDGRIANVDLADRVALSPSPCLRRVQRLEKDGVIRGYRAEVDRAAAGFGLTVFVGIKVQNHTKENADKLAVALDRIPEVISCHMVSGNRISLPRSLFPISPPTNGF